MEKRDDCKRKRSENFCEKDKTLLKELIKNRVNQIENKNTDANTNNIKKKAWLEVVQSYNNLCIGGQRTMVQLKSQWTAIKIIARKHAGEHRKKVSKTGGGCSQPEDISVSSNDISAWLPNDSVVDPNEFDSEPMLKEESVELIDETSKTTNSEIEEKNDESQIESKMNISGEIPKSHFKLKKKMPAKMRNITTDSIRKLTEFDIECRNELHELQIEAEKKRIRNLDREYDLIEAKIKFYESKPLGAAYFDGYNNKTFLDEVCRGLKVVRNRHKKNHQFRNHEQAGAAEEVEDSDLEEREGFEVLPSDFIKKEELICD